MKRQRNNEPVVEAAPWQAPYDLQLAKFYFDNGNHVLAHHSYSKWYNSLSETQQSNLNHQTMAHAVLHYLDYFARMKVQAEEHNIHEPLVQQLSIDLAELVRTDYTREI